MLKFPKTSERLPPKCYISFIIQLRFLQQYFPIPVLCNITRYYMAMRCPSNKEPLHSNGKLLGILCEKRQDAVVVMNNKHFITLVSVHIMVIAS